MSKVTAQEVRLVAHYGFPRRLDAVINAVLGYQTARAALRRKTGEMRDSQEAMDAAIEVRDQLPENLRLFPLAEQQLAEAQRNLANAQRGLSTKTEDLFEACGDATDMIICLLEEHDWDCQRPKLLEALERPLSTP